MIPVNEPRFGGREAEYVAECVRTGWISSAGRFIDRFEEEWARYCGRRYGVAVANGTLALEAAVRALDLEPGDEVIIPTFTIISCAEAVVASGGVPVLVDADPETWCMDASALADRVTRRVGDPVRVRKAFVCAGFVSASLLTILVFVDKGGPVLPVLLAALMGVGIAAGNYWALSQAATPPHLIGRALGFQNMVAQMAGAAAPVFTGLLLGPEQNFQTAILVAGFCPLVSVAAIISMVRVSQARHVTGAAVATHTIR